MENEFYKDNGTVTCDAPNNGIYKFAGRWDLDKDTNFSLGID